MTSQALPLPWLEQPKAKFVELIKQQRLAHGQLVGLPQGYGGLLLAQSMARAALCSSLLSSGPCGFCKSCQLFEAGNHPDFYHLVADGKQIKVDQIRELSEKLQASAQQGGYRVALISQSERMNTAAANALLKTLEEPGAKTLLILQTDSPAKLMPTVISRCQKVEARVVGGQEVRQWLKQQLNAEEDIAWCLSVVGGPLPLLDAWHEGRYKHLLAMRKDWQLSLSSGHLCASLLTISEEQIVDALKILYLVLHQGLKRDREMSPFMRMDIVDLANQVMQQAHQLSLMASVNYTGLCQKFVLQYAKIVKCRSIS